MPGAILSQFSIETALLKVRAAEDAWNSRDPDRVALAYTQDSLWRNRTAFIRGRDQIRSFLAEKWRKEHDYRLAKELWGFRQNRIAVRFQYEWRDDTGQWFRSYGNELWEFDDTGLMRRREASINDLAITERERRFFWPPGSPRPEGAPGVEAPNESPHLVEGIPSAVAGVASSRPKPAACSPSPNIRLIAGFFESIRNGDVPGATGILATDVDWLESGLAPLGGRYRGRESVVRDVLIPFVGQFTEFSATPERFIDAGDEVIACGVYRGTLKSSGRRAEARFMNLFKVRHGVVTCVEQLADTAHFVAAPNR
jgi:hypothetical protein